MSLVEGTIDYFGRAIVNIDVAGQETVPLRCQIDTGFNRSLLMSVSVAREFNFRMRAPQIVSRIRTAATGVIASELWSAEIQWLGKNEIVDANVVPHDPIGSVSDGRPDALLGVELLRGLHLSMDFYFNRFTLQRVFPAVA
jgi:predicted aspartyl protease